MGRPDEALALLQRSLAIYTKAYGPAHAKVAYPLVRIGDVLGAKGDAAGALASYRRALDTRQKALGADHPFTLHSMNQVAAALVELHRCAEARPLLATATAGLEKAHGAEHPHVAGALAITARCDLDEGRAADAVVRLERAIAIRDKANAAPVERGGARWLPARALWSVGRRDAASRPRAGPSRSSRAMRTARTIAPPCARGWPRAR